MIRQRKNIQDNNEYTDEENGVKIMEQEIERKNNKCDMYNSYLLSGLLFFIFVGMVTIFLIFFTKIVSYITLPQAMAFEEDELVYYENNHNNNYYVEKNETESTIFNILNEEYMEWIMETRNNIINYFWNENM